jgi:putative tryptophan/tyrosine transport system substrate-binding protein
MAARAQQFAMPVIGYLNLGGSPESDVRLTGLRRGLNQTGYVEGRNVLIDYRWAGNRVDRLPALVADLVQLRVRAIVATGLPPVLAAKAATTSIPIVFSIASDPVQFGLVASLNRPGGNLTGRQRIRRRTRGQGIRAVARLGAQRCDDRLSPESEQSLI